VWSCVVLFLSCRVVGAVRVVFVCVTCSCYVFLWRNHKNRNAVFRLVHPDYEMETYIVKVNVCTNEGTTVFGPWFRV